MINDRPNTSRYTHAGRWFLTLDFLKMVLIDAIEEWHYNEERGEEENFSSRMSYTHVTDEEHLQWGEE